MNDIFIKIAKSIRKRIDIPIKTLRSVRRRLLLPLTALVLAVSPLAGTVRVYAASLYDDLVQTTSTLQVSNGSMTIDMSDGPAQFIHDVCAPSKYIHSYDFYRSVLESGTGAWTVWEKDYHGINEGQKIVYVALTTDSSSALNFTTLSTVPNLVVNGAELKDNAGGTMAGVLLLYVDGSNNPGCSYLAWSPFGLTSAEEDPADVTTAIWVSTYPVTYPSGYEGNLIPATVSDEDSDGLDSLHEQVQGTSDSSIDTDGDGIDDLKESVWNPNRDATFCDTSTPKNCAYPDPTTQDVYVEIDWMNDGANSFKPNATQIGLVSDAFADEGIIFHADTGDYGGGTQLSTYTAPIVMVKDPLTIYDFFDYKSSNFSAYRQGIWRYMISGYNFSPYTNSSGMSYSGSDNIFISYGLIAYGDANENGPTKFGYSDLNTAIAGTMIHEIGHSLCLSEAAHYSHETSDCIYAGVDSGDLTTNEYPDYESSMNYANQMGMVGYSDGINGTPDDHDDWTAIKDSMGVFTLWDYATDYNYSSGVASKPNLSIAITSDIAKELKAKGLLKTGKAMWRHLEVKRQSLDTRRNEVVSHHNDVITKRSLPMALASISQR